MRSGSDREGPRVGERRTLWVCVLGAAIAAAGCPAGSQGPPIPAPRDGRLATFAGEAELRAYLAAAGRAREPRRGRPRRDQRGRRR